MRVDQDDEICTKKGIPNMVLTINELYAKSSHYLSQLIRDAENGTIHLTQANGLSIEINVENLARYLALHLISKILPYRLNENQLRHLLCGFRLLYTLCDLASRHVRLDQVLFDDVNVSEQMLDLIFSMIATIQGFRQEAHASSQLVLLHTTLLPCSLYLLTACISSRWDDLSQVLLAHPKVDMFMTATFPAVRVVVYSLQLKLSAQNTDSGARSNLEEVNCISHHCEACLQFLQSLCQQKLFREHLVKTKELCEEGDILLLVQDIMKLPSCEDTHLMAIVSRFKSRVLSILLHLCEVESVSLLDLAASTTRGLALAKSIVSEVLQVLKIMFRGDLNDLTASSIKDHPRGIPQLNAMRLTEILSNDSIFRSFIISNLTQVLATLFSLPHGEFMSNWCSSELEPSEQDVTLRFDSLAASGYVLGMIPPSNAPKSAFRTPRADQTLYAHQRTSLLVKIISNLTCSVEDLSKEAEGLFLNKFLECLKMELSDSPEGDGAERAAFIRRNMCSLVVHAESLIPRLLKEDDVHHLRKLEIKVQESIIPQVREVHNRGQCSSPVPQRLSPERSNKSGNPNEPVDPAAQLTLTGTGEDQSHGVQEIDHPDAQNLETVGTDPSSMGPRNSIENFKDGEEMQRKRRKRNKMNSTQISVIENALRDEPDMQRNAASIQSWADKLSGHGSEITPSQLKNWLNNRKARLARAAARDARVASGVEDGLTDKQGGSGADPDLPESPAAGFLEPPPPTNSFDREAGQYVILTNEHGEEMGRGRIHQTRGTWFGNNLEEMGLCVVDVTHLNVDTCSILPHPCDFTGTTFGQAEQILGKRRVLWDSSKLLLIRHHQPPR